MAADAGVSDLAAIVLAGGRASRLGGVDKPRLHLAGRTLLDRTISALRHAECEPIIVVGPEAGGGPAAALATALPRVDRERVTVWAADLARPALAVAALLAADQGPDGAVLVDRAGREQWLAGLYRTDALRAALAALGDPTDRALRDATRALELARVPVPDAILADIDTWEDYAQARERAGKEQE